ncbi:serine/threonine-protein phosphatase 4 regulatory subunit 4 isoform X2 [Nasonia vitripennis]|uniref:Phosphatase 2A Regulatory Subunit A helical domain-containing protein n=1 Tax=Nasonia vitripennis TaxID=7425 RepID=A0A7M7T706_NASVI|nr:serine/threonine-protein phosphatase 4 regulatory subunit 4 isoform X2 [Nasonia vitripennis]
MWQPQLESSSVRDTFDAKSKGDDIQKLSVIETLPQLLAQDAHSCITRVVPKIQQSLPTASAEFHMAASVIFKQILEQRLVSHSTFTQVFLQSILNSLENREPVISHAWLETILEVIELLPADIVKREILPIAVNEGQISQPPNSRIICCRLMGKIATRLDADSVKKDVLPTVQLLCRDINNDVRACICSQLRYIAEGLAGDLMKFLPFLIELADDEESNVRQAAVQTIGHLLPHLQPDTIKDIILPLIKITCENAIKTEDNLVCIIAQEFGKIAQTSESFISPTEKTWFVKYFIQLAQLGTLTNIDESKKDFTFITTSNTQLSDRALECRQNCASNMPAMLFFASSSSEGVDSMISTFQTLANDSYCMVRRNIACNFCEVIKVLGSKSFLIKAELIRLLKDDNEEVLQALIPQISEIIEHLLHNKLIGVDQNTESYTIDLGRALMKCESEISSTNNWRLAALMLNQLEVLPKCFPSDFIYTYLVPIVVCRVLNSRPLPVRLAAGRTLLIFLRYNLKPQQKTEIRNQICTDLARNSNCYVRMVFIRMMIECMSIFSSMYFKDHFCSTLLSLSEDSVANVRLKVITLVPTIKSCLRLPADKRLLSTLETNIRSLMNNEKDRDVTAALIEANRQMESIEVRVDSQPTPTKHSKYDSEDMKKYEEEKKLEAMSTGKTHINLGNLIKKPNSLKIPTPKSQSPPAGPDTSSKSTIKGKTLKNNGSSKSSILSKPPMIRQSSSGAQLGPDTSKASTSADSFSLNWSRIESKSQRYTEPWERESSSSHSANLTCSNPSYNPSKEYSAHAVKCSCYDLADRIIKTQNYRSDSSYCSCLSDSSSLKTTNLTHSKHDCRIPELAKVSLLTNARNDKHDILQDLMQTRSSFASKYKKPEYGSYQSNYNPYWSFNSMPELPSTLVDEEFMVDAGIRIPSQISTSQSTLKIPNLQDIIYRSKKMSDMEKTRQYGSAFEKRLAFGFNSTKRFSTDYDHVSTTTPSSAPPSSSSSSLSTLSAPSSTSTSLSAMNKHDQNNKSRFVYDSLDQGNPILENKKTKPNFMLMDKQQSATDLKKHHLDCKESKLKFQRHSVEVADYDPTFAGQTIRRFSTLDVNHNHGLSKIPVRSVHITGSRTAPVTRTSSPIRLQTELLESKITYNTTKSFSHDRRLWKFPSTDEQVDKLTHKF